MDVVRPPSTDAARHGTGAKTIVNALIMMPLWRIFLRGGLGRKAVIVVGLYWLVTSTLQAALRVS